MRVLVVEDNALLRHHLKVQLTELGHQVDAAEDAKEADYFLNEHVPDIAIVDLGLPDEDGLSLIRRWRGHEVTIPVLVLTAREGWQDKRWWRVFRYCYGATAASPHRSSPCRRFSSTCRAGSFLSMRSR